MSSQIQRRRFAHASVAASLLAVAFTFFAAQPASAHDELISSSPASGESVDTAPQEVVLEFSDEVLALGAIVEVAREDDSQWVVGEAVAEGPTTLATLENGMPDGQYEIRWRVVSSDGHPIDGVIPFSVGEPIAETETSAATEGAREEAEASHDEAEASHDDTEDTAASPILGGPVIFFLIAVLAAVAAVIVWLIVRTRRHRGSNSDAGGDAV